MPTVTVLLAEASRTAVPGGRMHDAIAQAAFNAGYPRDLASEALKTWTRAVDLHGYRKALALAAQGKLGGDA